MAKVKSAKAAEYVTREAMQILGGYGYSKEFPVERFWRDARVISIFEGTVRFSMRDLLQKSLLSNKNQTSGGEMFVLDGGTRVVVPRTELTYPGHNMKLHTNAASAEKTPVDHVMADLEDACPYGSKAIKVELLWLKL